MEMIILENLLLQSIGTYHFVEYIEESENKSEDERKKIIKKYLQLYENN